MTGSSDSNRSESQGGFREELSAKEGRSKDNDRRNTNRQRGWVRAISVRENAKSKSHRKTHQVEPDGTESKMFMHLTRGDLRREIGGGVSRGRSSEESRGNTEGTKGRRTQEAKEAQKDRGVTRNGQERSKTQLLVSAKAQDGWMSSVSNRGWQGRPVVEEDKASESSTAGCGKPHVRWCGRLTGRNPRGPIRSIGTPCADARSFPEGRRGSGQWKSLNHE
jgi:hypothetical protein